MQERALLWLADWLVNRRAIARPLPDNFAHAEFFKLGWVDSFGIVELIEDSERHFGIAFLQSELDDQRLGVIGGFAEIIAGAVLRSGKS